MAAAGHPVCLVIDLPIERHPEAIHQLARQARHIPAAYICWLADLPEGLPPPAVQASFLDAVLGPNPLPQALAAVFYHEALRAKHDAPHLRWWLGGPYALLQSNWQALPSETPEHPWFDVLVSFGAADPTGETFKVLDALAAWPPTAGNLHVCVVAGAQNRALLQLEARYRQWPAAHPVQLTVLSNTSDMPWLMTHSHIALGAMGLSAWERYRAGLFSLVTAVSRHQEAYAVLVEEDGSGRYLGPAAQVGPAHYLEALLQTCQFNQPCQTDAHRPQPKTSLQIDGWGAWRVAAGLGRRATVAAHYFNAAGLSVPKASTDT
jgi:hypothetical protein